jgi:hypothetical protein
VGTDCFVYLDDLILFSKHGSGTRGKLEGVLEKIDKANLQLHPGNA